MKVIEYIGGGTIKELIAAITGLKETTLRIELEKLVAAKTLHKTVTSLIPGISRGRNCDFFYLPESNTDRHFIQRQTLRPYALKGDTGFTSFWADSKSTVILTNKKTGEAAILVTDYEKFPDEWLDVAQGKTPPPEERRRIRAIYEGRSIVYVSYRLDLIERVKKAFPGVYTVDLGEMRESQSYRFKSELNHDTITRDNRQRAD